MKNYLRVTGVAASIFCNALLGGEMVQTISCRVAIARASGRRWAHALGHMLDLIDHNHCEKALDFWERYKRAETDFNASQINREAQ